MRRMDSYLQRKSRWREVSLPCEAVGKQIERYRERATLGATWYKPRKSELLYYVSLDDQPRGKSMYSSVDAYTHAQIQGFRRIRSYKKSKYVYRP